METLGTMDLGKLFQLLAGVLTCGFAIVLFIIFYIWIARRGDKAEEQANLDIGHSPPEPHARSTQLPDLAGAPAPSTPTDESFQYQATPIDVSARLAGTGREAWLEEATAQAVGTPSVEKAAPNHGKEVLRLVRDPATGQAWTKVAGMRYRSLSDIRDRAVGERVLAAITYALRFSHGMVATDQGVTTLKLPPCDAVRVPTAFGTLSDAHEPGEMVRLVSDPGQGDFCVHVAGRCYHRLADVDDRETGQCILEAITRLLQFSDGMLATNDGVGEAPVPSLSTDTPAAIPMPPVPSTPPQPSERSVMPAATSSTAEVDFQQSITPASAPLSEQEHFLQELMSQAAPLSDKPIERPSLLGSLRRMRKPPTAEPLPSLNLVDEIDRIFQSKLAASPLAETDARIEASPDGGVRIRVGAVYYDTPDDVPDANLRDMIKLSIAEWERS